MPSTDCKNNEISGDRELCNIEKDLVRAQNTAYRYLTYRGRSCKEVEKKLKGKKFEAIVIHNVIDHLSRLGYINDCAFAAQWAYGRIKFQGIGRRRIVRELNQKGVDKNTIETIIDKTITHEDEYKAAQKAVEKKLSGMKNVAPEVRRRRLAGYLDRKGYSYDIIREMLHMAG